MCLESRTKRKKLNDCQVCLSTSRANWVQRCNKPAAPRTQLQIRIPPETQAQCEIMATTCPNNEARYYSLQRQLKHKPARAQHRSQQACTKTQTMLLTRKSIPDKILLYQIFANDVMEFERRAAPFGFDPGAVMFCGPQSRKSSTASVVAPSCRTVSAASEMHSTNVV